MSSALYELQQRADFMRPTHRELWNAFRSIHSYPSSLGDIAYEAGMTIGITYNAIVRLEVDGLIICHSNDYLEWRLKDEE